MEKQNWMTGVLAGLCLLAGGTSAQAGTLRSQYVADTSEVFDFLNAMTLSATPPAPPVSLNDTYYFKQLQMDEAWKLTQGYRELKIAIVSTGVNYRLPSLLNSVAINAGERGQGRETDRIDNDQNGYVDDVYGANTHLVTGDPMDLYDLGTFEASLIVSPERGLAPNVQFIPVAVLSEDGAGTTKDVIKGIQYAVSRGADLILLNLGGSTDNGLCDAIEKARVPVIAPAGNEGSDLDQSEGAVLFPASCGSSNLIVTMSTDEASNAASFSTYGHRHVHVAAPGVKVTGLNRFGRPVTLTGGSVAGAITTGVAALVMSLHPEYSVFELREALIRGSDPIDNLADKVASGGRLNALKALTVNVR